MTPQIKEFIRKLQDNSYLIKVHNDLIAIHEKVNENIKTLDKKGDKGDSPTQEELLQLITPLIEDLGRQLKSQIPTLEDIKSLIPELPQLPNLPTLEEIVEALKLYIPKVKQPKTPQINLDLLAEQIKSKIKLPRAEKVEVTHEMILGALKKKKISLDMIDGLDKHSETHFDNLLRKKGLPHGGGDTVTAGTNVTITTTASGNKVISSSGGSGFTTLSATETPDGNVTVFTFSLASAKPSFIIVDNVWMQATTKSGSVNWTWANGPKQATLTIPPTEDILGVV